MKVEKSRKLRKYFELTNNVEYFERYKDFELHNKVVLYHLINEFELSIQYKDSNSIELSKSLKEVINYIFDCSID